MIKPKIITMSAFLLTLFLLLSTNLHASPITGTFSDGVTKVTLIQNSGSMSGTIDVDGEQFKLNIIESNGSTIKANIDFFGIPAEFTLSITAQGLTLQDGENSSFLPRASAASGVPEGSTQAPIVDNSADEETTAEPLPEAPERPLTTSGTIQKTKRYPGAPAVKMGKEVVEKYKGFAFRPPQDWLVRKTDDGYAMGHKTIPGLIALAFHGADSIDKIQQELSQGLDLGQGMILHPAGSLETYGENSYALVLTGTTPQPIKAYGITTISKRGGITVLAIVGTSKYSDTHPTLVQAIINKARSFKPVPPPEDKAWKERLMNRKLTYMYSSSSSGYDGSYTASSDTTRIGLCPTHFTYYSSSSYSVNAGGGSGSNIGSGSTAMGSGTGKGQGSWKTVKMDGKSYLILNFYDGREHEYRLTLEEYSTYLNGVKYFRTKGAQGPSCD